MKIIVLGMTVLSLFASGWSGPADQQLDQIMTEYLYIQSRLSEDSVDGIGKAAQQIARLSARVETADPRVQRLFEELKAAADNITEKELERAREAFFRLSKPLLVYLSDHYEGARAYHAYYCPMAQKGWIQSQEEVANPYYGEGAMLSCGELIPR